MEDFDTAIEVISTIISYYKEYPFGPTEEDFLSWINCFQDDIKAHLRSKGLQGCQSVLEFKIYYLDSRYNSMEAYLKENLTLEGYEFWCKNKAI